PRAAAARAEVVAQARLRPEFTAFVNAYTRCLNLGGKAGTADGGADASLLTDPAEKALWQALEEIEPAAAAAAAACDFAGACQKALGLVAPVNALFDAVMIMAEDEALRAARLALLRRCARTLGVLGDLTLLTP
ncbi:MAG: glycine--tRNA ligase subunit beta, partial [Gracilibacteraceae bacterium]|nr:glycine--tRNA ligase subunit beta [Gracilibacteraceae bacterium]